jgi:uncharacterized protein (TIGR03083 family)
VHTQTFADKVTVLQSETARITQYLMSLPPKAWSRPSACEAWQVQDVVAHLVGVAEFYADNIARGLQGDTNPPPGRPPAGTITAAVAAGGIAQRAIAERQKLGDQLLDRFRAANTHLAQVLAQLRPEQQTMPCYHPGGITQVHQFVDLRLKELAVHEWDIRASLEPPARLSAACLPAIIRLIDGATASGSLRWGFQGGAQLAAPVRYRFEITGPVSYHTDLVLAGDTIHQEARGDAAADVMFRCDTETFVLVLYGRLALDRAGQDGRVITAGDGALVMALAQCFKGI